MCGIAGRFNFRSQSPVSRHELLAMGRRMRHRGPDGDGIHVDGPLGLVHRRLSVIDLDGGAQPMSTADGALWICYNGEVFNYLEIFDELRARGYRPRTNSDTEAILLGYAEWGLGFVSRLIGMFAIAIWDGRLRRLVLCRDRLGVKPLYYAETPRGIVFASETKALRALPDVNTDLDLLSLDQYMTLGFVLGPLSMARGIRKLPPATSMTIDSEQGIRPHQYWRLQFAPERRRHASAWHKEIRETFDDSVRLRLRSDVPLGVLLSGGVDSTAIASTVARMRGSDGVVNSYCVGVDVPGAATEFAWARRAANAIGTQHHELRLSAQEHGEALLEATQFLDEPLAEFMVGQLLAVCRRARQDVTVLLSGEGADETWFGYNEYRVMAAIEVARRLAPDPLLALFDTALQKIGHRLPLPPKVAKYLRLAAEPLERRCLGVNQFDVAVRNSVYGPTARDALREVDPREHMRPLHDGTGGPELISRIAAIDCRAWLVDNTLLRSDMMSMAASLELRVPFLDHRLVELAARVPASLKVRLTSQKDILKKALADRIPSWVANRKKMGFPTPISQLLRSEWGRHAEEVLQSPSATTRDLFDRKVLAIKLRQHREGHHDWSRPLFQVLMLEYWAQKVESLDRVDPCESSS